MRYPDCPVCGSKMPITWWKYCQRQTCKYEVQTARRRLRIPRTGVVERRSAARLIKKVDGK